MCDQLEYGYYESFDFAIFAIFSTLVFEVGAQVGQHKLRIESSEYWGSASSKNEEKLKSSAIKGVRQASFQAIGLSLLIYIASAIGVSLSTRNLEERMIYIIKGLSAVAAAFVFAWLSFGIAFWTGLYFRVWVPIEPTTSTSLKEVKFKVRWDYYRVFTRYFFFLLPFYQYVTALTIPVSMIAGIAFGLFMGYGIYFARRRGQGWMQQASKSFVVLVIAVIASCFAGSAALYIAAVWEDDEEVFIEGYWGILFIMSFIVLFLAHGGQYFYSRRQVEMEATTGDKPTGSATSGSNMMAPNRPRMAVSLIVETFLSKSEEEKLEKEFVGGSGDAAVEKSSLNVVQDEAAAQDVEAQQVDGTMDGATEQQEDEKEGNERAKECSPQSTQDMLSEDGDKDQNATNTKQDADDDEPTYRQMHANRWTCCGCVRGKDEPLWEKLWAAFAWTVWILLVLCCLYLVVVNIGATHQANRTRDKLPYVQEKLYNHIDSGPVCAFDNKGPDSNITTFADKDAAHAAGFLIVHCGACAACSDWHNLRLEYTTRHYLAQESRKCAQKSLTGGEEAVLECMETEPIGFQGQCAQCWTDDVLCTKKHCAMIFLQAIMINAVTDMTVSPNTITSAAIITSAACEEANCEAGNPGQFVSCSGATRRRMNITSTIARPGDQRCSIVDVDWAELFPGE